MQRRRLKRSSGEGLRRAGPEQKTREPTPLEQGQCIDPSESRIGKDRTSGLTGGGEETQAITETGAPAQGESRRKTATSSV